MGPWTGWCWILAIACLLVVSGTARATPPEDANYQGRLLDSLGDPLAGPVDIEIGVWDQPAGGTQLYGETHSGVDLVDGVFNLLLGTGSVLLGTFDAELFATQNRYLEVIVDAETLDPRQPFSSVAYALRSERSEAATHADTAGDADTVDGSDATAFAPSAHSHSTLGAVGGTPEDAVYVDTAGNVGIGTTNPVQQLHVKTGVGHSFLKFTNAATGSQNVDGLTIGVNEAGDAFVYNREATWLRMGTANDTQLTISASGNVGVNDLFPDALLEVGATGGGTDLLMLSSSANGDGDVFSVKSSGNVGIGTVSPDEKLVVAGNLRISGAGQGVLFPDGTKQTTSIDAHAANPSAHHSKTISASELTTGVLPSARIADGGIGSAKLASGAVSNEKIAGAAVTPDKLSADLMQTLLGLQVVTLTTNIGSNGGPPISDVLELACPAGQQAIACGFETSHGIWHVGAVYPSGDRCIAGFTTCVSIVGGSYCPQGQEPVRLHATCVNASAL